MCIKCRMDIELSAIGARVRSERQTQHITQAELARLACFEQTRLSKLENGKSCPDLAALGRVAQALRKTLAWLFGEDATVTTDELTPAAIALARGWQRLARADQKAVCRIVDALAQTASQP